MIVYRLPGMNVVINSVSVDDYGTKYQAVSQPFEDSAYELVVVPMGTWWHLFDWDQEIKAEAECIPFAS